MLPSPAFSPTGPYNPFADLFQFVRDDSALRLPPVLDSVDRSGLANRRRHGIGHGWNQPDDHTEQEGLSRHIPDAEIVLVNGINIKALAK